MTKKELVNLLSLIETIYPQCIFLNETVLKWFEYCGEMDYERVMANLKKHIRNRPFPPTMYEIAVFPLEINGFPEKLEEWMKEGCERKHHNANRLSLPNWLSEYAARKSV